MDWTLRDAALEDAESLAELHVATFRETHGGGPPVSVRRGQWAELLARADPRDFTIVVQEAGGSLVAFARGTPHDGGVPGYEGVLNKIYVLRRAHRRGIGRRLVCAVAQRFLGQGVGSMLLFGDARSRANGFYERMGAEKLFSPEGKFHGGYGWPDLAALVARCR